jgi:hypothetical protein
VSAPLAIGQLDVAIDAPSAGLLNSSASGMDCGVVV